MSWRSCSNKLSDGLRYVSPSLFNVEIFARLQFPYVFLTHYSWNSDESEDRNMMNML